MLVNVHIKNLALIDDISIDFTEGLNIITGETGAGKSIVIDALKLGMGERITKNILRDDTKEGLCQLLFLVEDETVKEELVLAGVHMDGEGEVLISRKICGSRVINTINDEVVTAAKLKDISALFIDLHAQHEQQTLLKKSRHMEILDRFGSKEIEPLKNEMTKAYRDYTSLKTELEHSYMDVSEKNRRLDFLKYEISEIENASLVEGEDCELEILYKKIVNSKRIMEAVSAVHDITGYGQSSSAGNEIGRALIQLRSVKEYDPSLEDLNNMLTDIDGMLNDFNVSLKEYIGSMEFDEERFREVSDRLDVINELKGKYGRTIGDVNKYLEEKREEYNRLKEYDAYLEDLNGRLNKTEALMYEQAGKLSLARKECAGRLCSQVKEALSDLNFSTVIFEMKFDELSVCTSNGIDDCYFNISTNVGEPPRPLYEVASGGELSRIMLAIKSCMAGEDHVDTLIFDEIDVGISGKTAQSVSKKLSKIAEKHQVISITHLPQIAAMADSHYLIRKSVEKDRTFTEVTALDREGSIMEIARLLGGEKVTEAAVLNATELKELADKTKIIHY